MIKRLFNIYFFLFIFLMINREFTPFGFDFRILTMILGIYLLYDAIRKKRKLVIDENSKIIICFFALAFLSNFSWLFNLDIINLKSFFIIFISYVLNFLSLILFLLYYKEINIKRYIKYLYFSLIILSLSMVYCIIFGDLGSFISLSSGRISEVSKNFLGGTYRVSGFAQDPSYSSIFLMLGIITAIFQYKKNKDKKYFIPIFIFSFLYLFSASRIVLIAFIVAIIYYILSTKTRMNFNKFFICSIILIPIILIFYEIPIFDNILIIKQKFQYWSFARDLFLKNPLFGSGFTSFRAYFKISEIFGCNSTIFQVLSENGIISLILFGLILINNLNKKNDYLSILTILYSIYMINTDTLYQMYSIFFIGILPILIIRCKDKKVIKEEKNDNAIIFLTNSLCNGGAERVVVNMANEYARNFKVFIITLYNQQTYELNDNVKVINLYNKKLNSKEKIFKLFEIVYKVDKAIDNIVEKYNVKLITSHLIYSNLIARLSCYKEHIIHVIHVSYKLYKTKFQKLFDLFIFWIYYNVPVVTVSKGCEKELLNFYKVKTNKMTTIYNPINLNEIKQLANEKVKVKKPYILFVGRLDVPKRPELMIEIFYKGNFYKNYNLYLLGVGPFENKLKKLIKKYKIEDNVILAGWQNNVYSYMKNAELLVSCSISESFSMVLVEALACECKAVSFDIDYGPSEILTGNLKKYLAKNNDLDDLIKIMKDALNSYPKNLEKKIECFNVEKIDKEYLEISNKWKLNL